MKPRGIGGQIGSVLDHAPVLLVEGAWVVGKSTLCRGIADERGFGSFVDLGDGPPRRAAAGTPRVFVEQIGGSAVIVEAQLVPAWIGESKRMPEVAGASPGAQAPPG